MIPTVSPDSISNPGEKETYLQLQSQLPESWVVRYKFPFCWRNGHYLRDGEIDFIILAPNRGLLVLEAKSSHGYDCEKGIWFRIRQDGLREEAGNPFEQAMAVKHRLVERIAQKVFHRPKSEFPGLFGHAVIYPLGKVQGALPNSVEPTLMIAHKDMGFLHDRIEHAFHEWGTTSRGTLFTPKAMCDVEHFLSDNGSLVPVMAANVVEDERSIEELTQRQYAAFRGIIGNRRVHVRGTAGSGKTILATWAAEAIAKAGAKVLLVCFNRILASWLRCRLGGKQSFEVRSFFSLCREIIIASGLQFNVPISENEQEDFWTITAPALFCEALERSPCTAQGYDAIMVDEAQDFHRDWWFPIQLLLKNPDNGSLCLFSDSEQSGVYGKGNAFPAGLVGFELLENCRSTKRIATYCGRVLDIKVTPFRSSPLGVKPTILNPMRDPQERAKIVRRLVLELLDEHFSTSQIALLSPWRRSSPESALTYLTNIKHKPVQGGDAQVSDWLSDRIIWASTIRAFKGLEADCIILADTPLTGPLGFDLADLYVGASRAKHRLIIVPTSFDSASQLKEWAKGLA